MSIQGSVNQMLGIAAAVKQLHDKRAEKIAKKYNNSEVAGETPQKAVEMAQRAANSAAETRGVKMAQTEQSTAARDFYRDIRLGKTKVGDI